jgi:methionine-rich copper-binding protein CopC
MIRRPTRRACPLLAAFALLLTPIVADAHAKLARSDPPASSTLRGTPPEVRLWFTENLEPTFSGARLVDGERRPVDGATSRVDAVNAALLRLSLPTLAVGRYTVVYRVVSVDSHVTTGELNFRVAR